jgi:hypothetical protein
MRTVPSMARNLGLRRARLTERWYDDWPYLMSNPANAQWINDSIAELDRWREHRGAPPFHAHRTDAEAP